MSEQYEIRNFASGAGNQLDCGWNFGSDRRIPCYFAIASFSWRLPPWIDGGVSWCAALDICGADSRIRVVVKPPRIHNLTNRNTYFRRYYSYRRGTRVWMISVDAYDCFGSDAVFDLTATVGSGLGHYK